MGEGLHLVEVVVEGHHLEEEVVVEGHHLVEGVVVEVHLLVVVVEGEGELPLGMVGVVEGEYLSLGEGEEVVVGVHLVPCLSQMKFVPQNHLWPENKNNKISV